MERSRMYAKEYEFSLKVAGREANPELRQALLRYAVQSDPRRSTRDVSEAFDRVEKRRAPLRR